MANCSHWETPPRTPILENDSVHVWRIDLEISAGAEERLHRLLSEDERARAQRLRHPADRGQYIAAHGVLRIVLATYLDQAPGTLRFRYGKHGKPGLGNGNTPLHFNLSHSGAHALVAVYRDHAVGVDLERIRPNIAALKLAQRFFTAEETRHLAALPEAQRPLAFFRAWTRKEALVKAMGGSILSALRHIEVDLAAATQPGWRPRGFNQNNGDWLLLELPEIPEYASALAVAQGCKTVRCWNSMHAGQSNDT